MGEWSNGEMMGWDRWQVDKFVAQWRRGWKVAFLIFTAEKIQICEYFFFLVFSVLL